MSESNGNSEQLEDKTVQEESTIEVNNSNDENAEAIVITNPEVEEVEKPEEFVLGIDFATYKTVVSIAKINEKTHLPFVLHSPIGDLYHENIISYANSERAIGENVSSQLIVNPQTTVYNIKQYLGRFDNFDNLKKQTRFSYELDERGKLLVPINGLLEEEDTINLRVEQIAASVLKKYASYAETDMLYWQFRRKLLQRANKKVTGPVVGLAVKKCVLSVPMNFTVEQKAAIVDAATIAGLEVLAIIDDAFSTALTYALHNNNNYKPEGGAEAKAETVVIIDVGHTHVHSSINNVSYNSLEVKNCFVTTEGVGSHIETLLFDYAVTEIAKKYPVVANEGLSNRAKAKLQRAVQKAISVLSTIHQATIEVEYLLPDINVQLDVSRAQFENICAPALAAIDTLLTQMLEQSKLDLSAGNIRVEVLGGSSRVPAIQERIKKAFNGRELSRSLDSNASTGIGAAIYGSLFHSPIDGEEISYSLQYKNTEINDLNSFSEYRNSAADIESYVNLEARLCARDQNIKKIKDFKNSVEQFIYSFKDQCNVAIRESRTTSQAEACFKLLADEEEWLLYSEESKQSSFEGLQSHFDNLKAQLKSVAPDLVEYLDEKEKERIQKEKEAAEEELNRQVHHRDKLANPITPKEKLDAAIKRKDQGNEFFRDINYEHAVQRYQQALNTLFEIPGDKFKDEIQQTKLTCYLNLAMCFLNLKKYTLAADNCQSALYIEEKNVKALFRLGRSNYFLKKYDDAKKNFDDLLAIEPENKDAKKQLALVEKAVRDQAEKEKKMYASMFS